MDGISFCRGKWFASKGQKMRLIVVFFMLGVLMGCSSSERKMGVPSSGAGKVACNAVQVPAGKFFLIRIRGQHAAVKLTNATNKGDGGYEYVWYWQMDGSGVFTNDNAKGGKGEVFENYRHVKNQDGVGSLVNDGGVLYMECNGVRVEWSKSNWIYFDSPNGKVEIALTDESRIENINFLGKKLVWLRESNKESFPGISGRSQIYAERTLSNMRVEISTSVKKIGDGDTVPVRITVWNGNDYDVNWKWFNRYFGGGGFHYQIGRVDN
jgi:hypothetical protein